MKTLEEIIYETIRGIHTYGKDQSFTSHGGGSQMGQGNIGGPRNRGTPGYPVPPEMRTQTTSEPSLEEAMEQEPFEFEFPTNSQDDIERYRELAAKHEITFTDNGWFHHIGSKPDYYSWHAWAPSFDSAVDFYSELDRRIGRPRDRRSVEIAVRSFQIPGTRKADPTHQSDFGREDEASFAQASGPTDFGGKKEPAGFRDEPDVVEAIIRRIVEEQQTEVLAMPEYNQWYAEQDPEVQRIVQHLIKMLQTFGHRLGEPHSKIVASTNKQYSGMRYLRHATGQHPIRIPYMFNKNRQAVLLCAEDKKGKGDNTNADRALYDKAWKIWNRYLGVKEGVLHEGSVADSIVATIGDYQPFHKGHSDAIRNLANKFTKVIVFISGQKRDNDRPFSHELRLKTMKLSLPDVWGKIEVYPARYGNKQSEFMPGLLQMVVANHASSVKEDSAVNIVVPQEKMDAVQKQIDDNAQHQETPGYFKGILTVGPLEDGNIDDQNVRAVIASNDIDSAREVFDQTLVSNPNDFENVFKAMRAELKQVGSLTEAASKRKFVYWDVIEKEQEEDFRKLAKKFDVEVTFLMHPVFRSALSARITSDSKLEIAAFLTDFYPEGDDPEHGSKENSFKMRVDAIKQQDIEQDFGREDEIVEMILKEFGGGAMGGAPGDTRTGRHGAGAWSSFNPRGAFVDDEDQEDDDINPPTQPAPGADAIYQQMLRSPSTRMLPFEKGYDNHAMPGINSLDGDKNDEEDGVEKPTDLSKNVEEIVSRILKK